MENQAKVSIWTDLYATEVNSGNTLQFNPNDGIVLRMANRQYDKVFSLLSEGKILRIENLDLINSTLTQALNHGENQNAQTGHFSVFTSEHFTSQNEKFRLLAERGKQVYLTFGLLDYFDDNRMIVKSAPLVFMPVRLEQTEDKKFYQIRNVNHEVYLNEALISRLNESRRIDLSYPVENEFDLVEYLTYVATKVRNNHFSVNNGCFISEFDLSRYDYLQDYLVRQEQIATLPLVKSISYLNSEFFNLNKSASARLDNHYLSLLDLDNDEYKIMKRINIRENLVIKSNTEINREHLLTNIVYDFLLNNRNVLITYADEETRTRLLSFLKEHQLEDFAVDLSTEHTDKAGVLHRLLNHERLEYDVKLLDANRIDETVDAYYLIKNNFKKLINSLRRSNEPMKLSINRAIFEYYELRDVPMMNTPIPNADLIDETKLKEYLDAITAFVKSIDGLNCHYLDHPFYGFTDLNLSQEDYLTLKQKVIELSGEFAPCSKAYAQLNAKYHLPLPETLKEMKAILNILSLIPECRKTEAAYFSVSDADYQASLEEIDHHNDLVMRLNQHRSKMISIYGDKIFLINYPEFRQDMLQKPFNKKLIRTYAPYFTKKARIDETILSHLATELDEYYAMQSEIDGIYQRQILYAGAYREGIFQKEEIAQVRQTVKQFNENCRYLTDAGKPYSYPNLASLTDDLLQELAKDRVPAQIAFNHILNAATFIQQYFDKEKSDFLAMPFAMMENRIYRASRNFVSINDYLDFYLTYRKINRMIPSLGDELLKCSQTNLYPSVFMKRYYYDFVNTLVQSNPLFQSYSDDHFVLNIDMYRKYNDVRLEMMEALIKNNIRAKTKLNTISMKSIETPYLNALQEEKLKVLPLQKLLSQAKTSFLSLFPIFLAPVSEIPHLFVHQAYHFDASLVFGQKDLLTRDVLPASVRADQTIVFDERLLQHGEDDRTVRQSNETFICSALQSFHQACFISSSYNGMIMSGNRTDKSLKKYLTEKLIHQGFLVTSDVMTEYGMIDLLVKAPNSVRQIAVFLDRLDYYSLEAAIDSFAATEEKTEAMGYACYRLFTSFFFLNEEEETTKLVRFILENSARDRSSKKVRRMRPLVEVLFEEYQDPETFFLSIPDKKSRSSADLMMELLNTCAPMAKPQIMQIFGDEAVATLSALQTRKLIRISNDFVFVSDKEILFRRVKRDSGVSRNFDYVSNEEIAAGICQITTQKSLPRDDMIKLILLALGRTKMNHSQYFRIQNIIQDLIESHRITAQDDILYFQDIPAKA